MRAVLVLLAFGACKGAISIESPDDVADVCERKEPENEVVRVEFPAKAPGCGWGENGNLEMAQGAVTARQEERVRVTIPEGGVICGMGFDFKLEADVDPVIEYDDNMFFLYNEVLLAASYGPMVEVFALEDGLPVWDWQKLAGYNFGFDPATPSWCLGEAEGRSRCEVPPPETTGPLNLDFDADLVNELSFRAVELGKTEFGFVTIGDNDPELDCRHEAFAFDVTLPVVFP